MNALRLYISVYFCKLFIPNNTKSKCYNHLHVNKENYIDYIQHFNFDSQS